MNKLTLPFLIYFLLIGSVNAELAKPSIASPSTIVSSYPAGAIRDVENKLTVAANFLQASPYTSETDSRPASTWLVALGLCLVFVGYKIKTKAA